MGTTLTILDSRIRPCLEALGLRWYEDYLRCRLGEVVNRTRTSTTRRIRLETAAGHEAYYLKVCRPGGRGTLFRRDKTRLEARNYEVLRDQCGVNVPDVVALGSRRCRRRLLDGFILTRGVPNATPLDAFVVAGWRATGAKDWEATRRYLLAETAAMVSRMHAAGFCHVDLQWRNLLVAENGTPRPAIYVIDSERGALRHSAVRRAHGRLRDLSSLYKEARRRLTRSEQIRWLRRYLGVDKLTAEHRAMIHTILRDRSIKDGSRTQDVRTSQPPEENTASDAPRLPDGHEHPDDIPFERHHGMIVDARAVSLLASAGITCLADAFSHEAGDSLDKPGLAPHRQRVRLSVADGHGNQKTFYLKRYRRPPLLEQWRRIRESRPGRSSAWREFQSLRRLGESGIPSMRPVACGEAMRGWWEVRSFSMTEAIDGQSLETLAAQGSADAAAVPGWRERREIIRQLALVARRLHDNRLFHRDLYLCHVIMSRDADGGIVLSLIDLARMIERPWRPRRWRIKDLASLDYSAPRPLVTRADRLRFLYDYLGGRDRSRRHLRRLAASIRRRVARTARHDAKRTRRHIDL